MKRADTYRIHIEAGERQERKKVSVISGGSWRAILIRCK